MRLQTILFPTDFSAPAAHAIQFGLQLVQYFGCQKIILLHASEINTAIGNQPIIQMGASALLQEDQKDLDKLQLKIEQEVGPNVTVQSLLAADSLIHVVEDLVQSENVDLVVMGVTGKNKLEQKIIGSNALSVMRKIPCPVCIVPFHAKLSEISSVVLAYNLLGNVQNIPDDNIKTVLHQFNDAHLYLLNIDKKDESYSDKTRPNITAIHKMFDALQPTYDYINGDSTAEALLAYTKEKKASLLILLEQQYDFIERIFHTSLTKQMIFEIDIPVLIFESKNKD